MILPVTGQRVIAVFLGQWLVLSQRRDDVDETLRQCNPMWAFSFAFQITLECTGLLNCPHQAPIGVS